MWISARISCHSGSVLHVGSLQRKSNHVILLLDHASCFKGIQLPLGQKSKLLSMGLKRICGMQS